MMAYEPAIKTVHQTPLLPNPLRLTGQQSSEHTEPVNPPFAVIQDWDVVLGDTQCGGRRGGKTTAATDMLRQVKEEFKHSYKGMVKKQWIPLAKKEFATRVGQTFPDQECLVLIKCTENALQSGRVGQPFTHGYAGDEQALYGIAKLPQALDFFLKSKDAPTLQGELATHGRNLAQLRQSNRRPPSHLLDEFDDTLQFFSRRVELADQGYAMAKRLLQDLCPINALKEQWNLLKRSSQAAGDDDDNDELQAEVDNICANGEISLPAQDRLSVPDTTLVCPAGTCHPLDQDRSNSDKSMGTATAEQRLENELLSYLTAFLNPTVCCLCQHKVVGPWAHSNVGMFQIVDSMACCAPMVAIDELLPMKRAFSFSEFYDSEENGNMLHSPFCATDGMYDSKPSAKRVRTSAELAGKVFFDLGSSTTTSTDNVQLPMQCGKSMEPQGPQKTLWSALRRCRWDVARMQMRQEPLDVNYVPRIDSCEQNETIGFTTLHVACQSAAPLDIIRRLLQLNPSAVSCQDANGATPLHMHLSSSHVKTTGVSDFGSPDFMPILDLLLNQSVTNAHDRSVGSPLHLICNRGHSDSMKEIGVFRRLLLAGRSQIFRKDESGNFPCDLLWQLYLNRHEQYQSNPFANHKPAPQILRILFLFLEDEIDSDNLQDVIRFQSTCEWLRSIDFVRLFQEACSTDAAAAA